MHLFVSLPIEHDVRSPFLLFFFCIFLRSLRTRQPTWCARDVCTGGGLRRGHASRLGLWAQARLWWIGGDERTHAAQVARPLAHAQLVQAVPRVQARGAQPGVLRHRPTAQLPAPLGRAHHLPALCRRVAGALRGKSGRYNGGWEGEWGLQGARRRD